MRKLEEKDISFCFQSRRDSCNFMIYVNKKSKIMKEMYFHGTVKNIYETAMMYFDEEGNPFPDAPLVKEEEPDLMDEF
jgi:hypothetical protein